MLREIWLIRHAEAYNTVAFDNDQDVIDPKNPPLTLLGKQQAEELRDFLLSVHPERIIVSPFLRAVQTAVPYLAVTGQKAVVDFRICETFAKKTFQDFQGMKRQSYPDEVVGYLKAFDEIENRDKFPSYPESVAHIKDRTGCLWEEYKDSKIRKIAFIGHGASMALLAQHIMGDWELRVGHCNAGVSHLCRKDDKWVIVYLNKTSHLTRTGEPAYI